MAVTSPASTFCQPTKTTFAVFTIASAASIIPTSPRVSTIPSASPSSRFSAIRRTCYHGALREHAGEVRGFESVAREHRVGILEAEMADDNFAEHVAEIGRHGEVAPVVALFPGQPWPSAVDAAAAHVAADHEHGVAVAVIRAAIAVLTDGAAEFRHGEDNSLFHPIAEIGDERGDAPAEVVEPRRQLPLRAALVDVGVPSAQLDERDLESDTRLRELRDLLERLAERTARVVCSVLGLVA